MDQRASGVDSSRATPSTSSNRQLALIISAAGIVGLIYGYDLGSIAGAALFLKPDMALTTLQLSLVVSAVSVGNLVGAFVGGWITNALGRKRTMLAIAAGYAVFSGLQGLAPEVVFLIAVRFILGCFIGVSIVAAPAFIAESSPARTRGAMLVTFQIATTSGQALSYLVGFGLAETQNWRLILALAALPAVLVFIVVLRLPDTARWYLMKGRRDEAMAVLLRTHSPAEAEREADLVMQDLSFAEKGSMREVFRGPMRKAGIFAVGLGFSVQITGIQAIVQYSPTILSGVGFASASSAILAAALVQLIGVVAEVIAFLVVDRWGRRPTLLTGVGIMCIANLVLVVAYLGDTSAVLTVLGLLLFTIGFNFGYGALVWVYASESLPAKLRTQGASALLTADLIANVLVSFLFLNLLGVLGGSATFGIFLVLALVAVVFIYRLAPETKGRRLEDIRHYWLNGGRWPDRAPEQQPTSS